MKIFFVTYGDITLAATMKRATGMAEHLIDLNNKVSIIALDCDANRKRFKKECPNANILYFNIIHISFNFTFHLMFVVLINFKIRR